MKNKILILALLMSSCSIFAADNIAVVDLQQLVNSSAQVKQLKQEHSKKIAELDKIIVNARGEISNEKDPAKILLIEDKYMKEFNTKKESLEQDYNNRLSAIEKNIKDKCRRFLLDIFKNNGRNNRRTKFSKSRSLCENGSLNTLKRSRHYFMNLYSKCRCENLRNNLN